MPTLADLHGKNVSQGQTDALTDTTRGSAVSALLTQTSANINTTLLIPKTEKLSPVQLYGTDRNSLTGTAKWYKCIYLSCSCRYVVVTSRLDWTAKHFFISSNFT